ncbi:arsenical pump membrane protein [Mariprofundus micogutta]|uniref:Arsenical pump membrane protein n=1 Tax=Mariprofundus micogutta TaxID=1921010 RepID=A0A1L8CPR8_9PROT|nr:ArsB/NhaD family transporter [Mariprofundus micogutta]GAV20926.1 arsenical pump membrane protein [Mariprofundus micogutta]
MHNTGEHIAASVIFGLDPTWVAVSILLVVYAFIMMERFNRAVLSLLGAGLMILCGVVTQQQAVAGVDFNTIGLLTGMMVIVAISQKTGMFQYVAIKAAKMVKGEPWGILVMLSVVTAVFSAFLDNVTTVLLIAPVTLLITDALGVKPYPYLFAQILASNIGGTATLIGDPPNIMIGSAANLSFYDFLVNLMPITPVIFVVILLAIWFMFGRDLHASEENKALVMRFDENEAIKDVPLLKKSLAVLFLVIGGFTVAHSFHLEPASIAMFGAAVLLLLQTLGQSLHDKDHAYEGVMAEVEWTTIFFFVGLFIVVTGVEHTGVIEMLAHKTLELTGGDFVATAGAILWVSAIASALIDNIPFVATMIPLIQSMAPTFGGSEALVPLWWALALGACLGGNGSLIGASANLIVAGFAQRAGHPIAFLVFMKHAFGLMLISIAIAHAYLYFRYLS